MFRLLESTIDVPLIWHLELYFPSRNQIIWKSNDKLWTIVLYFYFRRLCLVSFCAQHLVNQISNQNVMHFSNLQAVFSASKRWSRFYFSNIFDLCCVLHIKTLAKSEKIFLDTLYGHSKYSKSIDRCTHMRATWIAKRFCLTGSSMIGGRNRKFLP